MASTLSAVSELVSKTPQDDQAVKSRCQVALQLAQALDDAVVNQELRAVAAISKELRSVIDELSSVEGRKEAFRASLFND